MFKYSPFPVDCQWLVVLCCLKCWGSVWAHNERTLGLISNVCHGCGGGRMVVCMPLFIPGLGEPVNSAIYNCTIQWILLYLCHSFPTLTRGLEAESFFNCLGHLGYCVTFQKLSQLLWSKQQTLTTKSTCLLIYYIHISKLLLPTPRGPGNEVRKQNLDLFNSS